MSYYAEAWLPARDIVERSYHARKEVHPSGRIVLFEDYAPWKVSHVRKYHIALPLTDPLGCALQEHLFDIESESQSTAVDHPYYIIYPDEFGGNWRVQAVPVAPESFDSRKALPEVYVLLQLFNI